MYLFDEDDLRALILNEELFALFNLLDRERKILFMHHAKGYTFQFIAGVFGVSKQTIHRSYCKGLVKMREGIVGILEEYCRNQD